MPFGSEWVRDQRRRSRLYVGAAGSPMPFGSEWVRDETFSVLYSDATEFVSPMPFGSEWVRDSKKGTKTCQKGKPSPMPFGSEWVRDGGAMRGKAGFPRNRLQCLSAVSGSGTRTGRNHPPVNSFRSPMPFGSEWVRDLLPLARMGVSLRWSPMPFGSEWVRDSTVAPLWGCRPGVSNAFRQ